MKAEELRSQLEATRAGRVYPAGMRDAVLDYAAEQRQRGFAWKEVAAELGVHETTIRYWQKVRRPGKGGALERVVIAAAPVRAVRELVVECGALRVRGLDMTSLLELLRGLQ